MKKNFALLLALVMLVACILAVMRAADETAGGVTSAESYKPTIAYANINYVDDLTLMFAVPAPASLDDGSSVKVVVWTISRSVYSYNDAIAPDGGFALAIALEAEDARVTIGGTEHLVFKYEGLLPEQMTDIVSVRAVVVDKDNKATAYGDLINYSAVEYVETAKGSFNNGNPVIENEEVLELLDSILDFGAMMQTFYGEDKIHAPNGYFANDDLHKIWVTPIVAGRTLDKVFAGFFKYEEGGYATVRAPFFDGYEAATYKDAGGNLLTDANDAEYDEGEGFQIDAVDADIEVVVEYGLKAVRKINSQDFGAGFGLNNAESGVINGDFSTLGSLGSNYSSGNYMPNLSTDLQANFSAAAFLKSSFYSGIRTVEDSDNPGNYLFLITSTDIPTITMSKIITPAELKLMGYGDTVDEALTVEVEIGRPSPTSVVKTAPLALYNASSWGNSDNHDTNQRRMNLFKILNNKVILLDNVTEICELPETGLVKIAVTITAEGELKAYSSNADGEMILRVVKDAELYMSVEYKEKHAKYLANLADDDPSNDEFYAPYKDVASYLSQNSLKPTWTFGQQLGANAVTEFETATVEMGGVQVPLKNANGTYNYEAVKLYAENKYSFLLKSWNVYVGDVYK